MSLPASSRPLGRGLSALLGPDLAKNSQNNSSLSDQDQKIFQLSIHDMSPGRYQPREVFDQESLDSLKASIQTKGVIQPILVRPLKQGLTRYEIIGGERRWRAAKDIGFTNVPALVREMTDLEALETGLIENIQRHDLNPLEEAQGFKKLMEEFNYTQEDLAKALGKSRSYVANAVRLLNLSQQVQEAVRQEKITAGHARALVGITDYKELLNQIIRDGLNVRQTERLVQTLQKNGQANSSNSYKNSLETVLSCKEENDNDLSLLATQLSEKMGKKVTLSLKANGEGVLQIHFKQLEDLDNILKGFSAVA